MTVPVRQVRAGYTEEMCVLWQACVDMLPGSAFLNELNAGNPAPGAIPYFHLYSNNGEVGEKNPLPGATNASVQSFCLGRFVGHTTEWDDGAMRGTATFSAATTPQHPAQNSQADRPPSAASGPSSCAWHAKTRTGATAESTANSPPSQSAWRPPQRNGLYTRSVVRRG